MRLAHRASFSILLALSIFRDLPPSQGGKYVGFGNPACLPFFMIAPNLVLRFLVQNHSQEIPTSSSSSSVFDPNAILDDPFAALTRGFSFVTKRTSMALSTLNQSVIQPTKETLVDPEFTDRVTQVVGRVSKTVYETGKEVGRGVTKTVTDIMTGPETQTERQNYASGNDGWDNWEESNQDDFWQQQEQVARQKTNEPSQARISGRDTSSNTLNARSGVNKVGKRRTKSKDWNNDDEWQEF